MNIRPCIFLAGLLLLAGCKRTKACLEEDSYLVEVGDTLQVNGCPRNADVYLWELNDRILITSQLFGADEYTVVNGGTHCDDFLEIVFHETGDYDLLFHAARLESGSCESGNFSSVKGREVEVEITVVP